MFDALIQHSKKWMVSLRFSILTIFVTLFVLSMAILITITHVRFIQSMEALSFELMQQASMDAFNQIQGRIKNAEMKSYSVGQLIQSGVIDLANHHEIVAYASNFMQNETNRLSPIQAMAWGEPNGDYVVAEKMQNGRIHTEVIERGTTPHTHKVFESNAAGKMVEISSTRLIEYDPRTRPWYLAAIAAKKPVWLGIYFYQLTGHQGTAVSTPVFRKDGSLLGVVNLQIRLDNLRTLVERTPVSEHSVVFILSTTGKLIAYPKLTLLNQTTLFNIHDLVSAPWVIRSFDLYKQTGRNAFAFEDGNKKYLATFRLLSYFGKEQWMIGIVAPVETF